MKKVDLNIADVNVKEIVSNVRSEKIREILYENENIEIKHANVEEFDVGVFEILNDDGSYNWAENIFGRSVRLYEKDIIIAVFGERCSAQNLCGHVNDGKSDEMEYALLTNGGIVGICDESPIYKGKPTRVKCHGIIYYKGEKLNTLRFYKENESIQSEDEQYPKLIFVCGTSGETGKTSTARMIINGIAKKEKVKTAGIKVSGTGCMEDILEHKDAGAFWIEDLSSVGVISSYTDYSNVKYGLKQILCRAKNEGADVCVCECGGDIIGGNVYNILNDDEINRNISAITLNYNDIMGVLYAIKLFEEIGLKKNISIVLNKNHNTFGDIARLNEWNNKFDYYNFNNKEQINMLIDKLIGIIKE